MGKIHGGWSKHSCRRDIRNDLAPALALPCALQGLYRAPLHRLKYVFTSWLPQKVAQRGLHWSTTLCNANVFSLRKQNLMIRSSKSQKSKMSRDSAGSASISLIAAWGGRPSPRPVSPTEFADHHTQSLSLSRSLALSLSLSSLALLLSRSLALSVCKERNVVHGDACCRLNKPPTPSAFLKHHT